MLTPLHHEEALEKEGSVPSPLPIKQPGVDALRSLLLPTAGKKNNYRENAIDDVYYRNILTPKRRTPRAHA